MEAYTVGIRNLEELYCERSGAAPLTCQAEVAAKLGDAQNMGSTVYGSSPRSGVYLRLRLVDRECFLDRICGPPSPWNPAPSRHDSRVEHRPEELPISPIRTPFLHRDQPAYVKWVRAPNLRACVADANTQGPTDTDIPAPRLIVSTMSLDLQQRIQAEIALDRASNASLGVMYLELQQRIQAEIALDRLLEEWVQPDERESHDRSCAMSRLPAEIVSEIFCHLLAPHKPKPLPSEGPLLLCQICAQWREIALSTPRLWSAIVLVDPRSQGTCLLLDAWLSRARRCPLCISLEWTDPGLSGVLSTTVWNIIEPFSHQLEHIILKGSFGHFIHFPFVRCHLPSLKRLFLVDRDKLISGDELLEDITIFREAPMLETVSLEGHAAAVCIPLPWTQLKELNLLSLDMDTRFQCLRRARNITQCLLLGPSYFVAGPQLAATPELKSLHSLCMIEVGGQDGALLSVLTLPALVLLCVCVQADDRPNFTFLTRSNAHLRFPRLTTNLDEGFILQCLNHQSASSLEELELFFRVRISNLLDVARPARRSGTSPETTATVDRRVPSV
ncbi:hypothetical protein B0H11DRAFT_2292447 [Mycena galericulata]|nr:hypothetical protein B0H11DRAFT_2292447 [Mycena galericulata]